jgi:hypothetical protein
MIEHHYYLYIHVDSSRVESMLRLLPSISQYRISTEPSPNGVHLKSANDNITHSLKQRSNHHSRMTMFINCLVHTESMPFIHLFFSDFIQETVHLCNLIPGGFEIFFFDDSFHQFGILFQPCHEFLFVHEHVMTLISLNVSSFLVGCSQFSRCTKIKFYFNLVAAVVGGGQYSTVAIGCM